MILIATEETINPVDTTNSPKDYRPSSSVNSAGVAQTDRVADARIDSVPPTFVEATFVEADPDSEVQGGRYCVRNTRVPVASIKEAVRDGYSYKEIAKSLKENFGVGISPTDIRSTVKEYDNQTIQRAQ